MILNFNEPKSSMHKQLTDMLFSTEVIWIYDELNRCAIIQQTFKHGLVLYCAMVHDGFQWRCIDIQETDIHGAQTMYECLLKALRD